eukprot:199646-Rhodomonas_salina.4
MRRDDGDDGDEDEDDDDDDDEGGLANVTFMTEAICSRALLYLGPFQKTCRPPRTLFLSALNRVHRVVCVTHVSTLPEP